MKKSWRFILLLFFLTLLENCQYFKKDVPNKDVLLKKELNKVNWEEVDEMPSINYCDSIENPELKQACFFDYFKLALQQKLKNDTIKKLYPKLDSLQIKVTVFPDASLKFEPNFNEEIKREYNISVIDSLLQTKLTNFSPVQPAIKRGIKVKSAFYVPIVL